jgi:hypothetical protein
MKGFSFARFKAPPNQPQRGTSSDRLDLSGKLVALNMLYCIVLANKNKTDLSIFPGALLGDGARGGISG